MRSRETLRAVFVAGVSCAVAHAAAGPGVAASLLPGEALCSSECETLTLPPELDDAETAEGAPLWPLRFKDDAGRDFLGDYAPDGSLLPDPDAAPDGDPESPDPDATDPIRPR